MAGKKIPSIKQPPNPNSSPTPTGSAPAAPVFNIAPKTSGTGKGTTALAFDGTKNVPTTDLKKQWLLLPADQKKYIINYAASIGQPAGKAQSIWNNLVAASQASVQQGKPLSPLQILQRAGATGQAVAPGLPNTVRKTGYNDTEANALARAAYTKIFGRIPTDLELSAPANIPDPKTGQPMVNPKTGQPLTWAQALQQVSNNSDFQESTSYTLDAKGNVKDITTKPAIDANTWLETSMSKYYAKSIASGQIPPEAQMEQQYAQLGAQYGQNVYDPNTKELTASARIELGQLEAGNKTLAQVKQDWANLAIPSVATSAHQGLQSGAATLKDFAQPAISRVAALLEKNPDTITVNDPYVQKYLKGDGKSFMSPAELDSTIKSDPSWPFTQNAKAQFSDIASQILTRFGVNA